MGLAKSIYFLPYTEGAYIPVSRPEFLHLSVLEPPLQPAVGVCPKKLVTQASDIIFLDCSKALVQKDAVKDGIRLSTCEINTFTPNDLPQGQRAEVCSKWGCTWLVAGHQRCSPGLSTEGIVCGSGRHNVKRMLRALKASRGGQQRW